MISYCICEMCEAVINICELFCWVPSVCNSKCALCEPCADPAQGRIECCPNKTVPIRRKQYTLNVLPKPWFWLGLHYTWNTLNWWNAVKMKWIMKYLFNGKQKNTNQGKFGQMILTMLCLWLTLASLLTKGCLWTLGGLFGWS